MRKARRHEAYLPNEGLIQRVTASPTSKPTSQLLSSEFLIIIFLVILHDLVLQHSTVVTPSGTLHIPRTFSSSPASRSLSLTKQLYQPSKFSTSLLHTLYTLIFNPARYGPTCSNINGASPQSTPATVCVDVVVGECGSRSCLVPNCNCAAVQNGSHNTTYLY